MSPRSDQIIVALDHTNFDECKSFVNAIGSQLRFVKIGSVLYSVCGPQVLEFFAKKNVQVFLDLKYHDIPNTVANSIAAVLRHAPIAMLTIHASGGSEMIRAAKNAILESESNSKTKLLSVTILTSLDQKNLKEIGFKSEQAFTSALQLAMLAEKSGTDGIVCSPQELSIMKTNFGNKILFVVPGIRPAFLEKQNDDQKRTATPEYAFENGANYVVIGRPITQAKNPEEVFRKLIS